MKDFLRFRQIHLDFHTSPAIPGVGAAFSKCQFQDALKAGCVDSINIFSKCHHGWSYHPTQVGKMHPHLKFNLLGEQIDACHEIGVLTPVYISAGVDNVASQEHPEWRRMGPNGQYAGWVRDLDQPGFHTMCFNTPYLDYLCAQIQEVIRMFPKSNGIWLDIIGKGECCCTWCRAWMRERGLDFTKAADRDKAAEYTLRKYYERTTKAVHDLNPKLLVFHNSGHIAPGNRSILPFFTQIEMESLPTGGWGYDHFPMSAKYVNSLGKDYLGMTGKFHTWWGEFGGFKHPNALRYECAAMLAYGSKCSVGDQLHPNGKMDMSTYKLIGEAFQEVEVKEPWCRNVQNIADIGVLMSTALAKDKPHMNANRDDTGVARLLLEGHFLFDMLDGDCDFDKYKMLIVPDSVSLSPGITKKLDAFLKKGGKILLAGKAGLDEKGTAFLFDVGAECKGASEFRPDYILPTEDVRPSFVKTPLVMYYRSQRIRVKKNSGAISLGKVYDPYFNRTANHFCSHQHTPNKPSPSGFDCGVRKGNILYLAHPVFTQYNDFGTVAYKEYVHKCLRLLLGSDETVRVEGLPSTGRITLVRQPGEKRMVFHALYANTVTRGSVGGEGDANYSSRTIEVIEEIVPLYDIRVTLRLGKVAVKSVRLVPEGKALDFTKGKDGTISFTLPKLLCHQMVEIV